MQILYIKGTQRAAEDAERMNSTARHDGCIMVRFGFMSVQPLAVDVSLAALLGDKVYSFGELLLHPIVSHCSSSCAQACCARSAHSLCLP